MPSEVDVKGLSKEFHARLRQIVDGAWAKWSNPDHDKRMYFPTARAIGCFRDIAKLAVDAFNGDTDIQVVVKRETIRFFFRDRLWLLFRMHDFLRAVAFNKIR